MPPSTTPQPTTAAQHAAYRRLALTVLGADVPTLLAQLQQRREVPAHSPAETGPESLAA
jgi:hypothetical protein